MPEDNGRFMISHPMAEYIKLSPLGPSAKKLLIALIYLQHLEEDEWPTVVLDEEPISYEYPHEHLCRHYHTLNTFRTLGFAPNSKSARFLDNAIHDLRTKTDLFDALEVEAGTPTVLFWQFSIHAAALMTKRRPYALMHTKDIARTNTDLEPGFITLLTLHENMDWPEFSLFKAVLHNRGWEGFRSAPIPDKRVFKPKLKRLLRKWSALKSHEYAVVICQNGERPGVTDVRIRVRHARTKWSENSFYKVCIRDELVKIPKGINC